MKKWSCNSDSVLRRDPVCPDSQRQSCVLTRVAHNVTCERRFSTCFECPNTYPWLGNPDGNIYEVGDAVSDGLKYDGSFVDRLRAFSASFRC